jgi:hypothetical protein
LKQATAILAALLLLLSTVPLTVGLHYCSGVVQSVALFGEAEPCHHANPQEGKSCPFHPAPEEATAPGCCEDDLLQSEGLAFEVTVPSQTTAPFLIPVPLPAALFPEPNAYAAVASPTFFQGRLYHPPPLIHSVSLPAIQVFLI